MKNVIGIAVFCVSFFSFVSAAEIPEQSPFVTRGKALGDTGALAVPGPDTPRPSRANSSSSGRLQRADTIKLNFPRKTSSGEGEKKTFYKSPRSKEEFGKTRTQPVDVPKEPVDFSKKPTTNPSYDPLGLGLLGLLAEKK